MVVGRRGTVLSHLAAGDDRSCHPIQAAAPQSRPVVFWSQHCHHRCCCRAVRARGRVQPGRPIRSQGLRSRTVQWLLDGCWPMHQRQRHAVPQFGQPISRFASGRRVCAALAAHGHHAQLATSSRSTDRHHRLDRLDRHWIHDAYVPPVGARRRTGHSFRRSTLPRRILSDRLGHPAGGCRSNPPTGHDGQGAGQPVAALDWYAQLRLVPVSLADLSNHSAAGRGQDVARAVCYGAGLRRTDHRAQLSMHRNSHSTRKTERMVSGRASPTQC